MQTKERVGSARWLLVAFLVIAALGFAACGGGDDETTTAGNTEAAETEQGSNDKKQGDAKNEDSGGESDSTDDGDSTTSSDSDSRPPINKNGRDVSIQRFGGAADEATAAAMADAVRSYFAALAANKPARACKLLASGAQEQFAQLLEQAAQAGQEVPSNPCKAFLANAARVYSGSSAPDFDAIEFNAFRVEDDRGFVLYKLPERPKSFMPVGQDDDGTWRVAAIDGSPLP